VASLFNQVRAVTALNILSIPQRAAMSIASIVSVALSVAVLLFFLALSNGLASTLRGSGADDIAMAIREGSNAELNSVLSRDQLNILAAGPAVRQHEGKPLVSGELLVIVDGKRRSSGENANIPFRGIGPEGLAARPAVRIIEGRLFAPGSNEVVVGAGLLREFDGFELGKTIRLRGGNWKVVGVFAAPGTVAESEMWADIAVTQSLFNRPNVYQTMRIQLDSAASMPAYAAWVKADTRLDGVEIESEREYFSKQASQSSSGFLIIGIILGSMMAVGALAGALNTMYNSVAARGAEIATLRIIGFSGAAAFLGTLLEALALSLAGGVLGVGLAFLAFNGRTTSTLGAGFTQMVFQFQLSAPIVGAALACALAIGFIGGVFPGIRAARTRPQIELAGQ